MEVVPTADEGGGSPGKKRRQPVSGSWCQEVRKVSAVRKRVRRSQGERQVEEVKWVKNVNWVKWVQVSAGPLALP